VVIETKQATVHAGSVDARGYRIYRHLNHRALLGQYREGQYSDTMQSRRLLWLVTGDGARPGRPGQPAYYRPAEQGTRRPWSSRLPGMHINPTNLAWPWGHRGEPGKQHLHVAGRSADANHGQPRCM